MDRAKAGRQDFLDCLPHHCASGRRISGHPHVGPGKATWSIVVAGGVPRRLVANNALLSRPSKIQTEALPKIGK